LKHCSGKNNNDVGPQRIKYEAVEIHNLLYASKSLP